MRRVHAIISGKRHACAQLAQEVLSLLATDGSGVPPRRCTRSAWQPNAPHHSGSKANALKMTNLGARGRGKNEFSRTGVPMHESARPRCASFPQARMELCQAAHTCQARTAAAGQACTCMLRTQNLVTSPLTRTQRQRRPWARPTRPRQREHLQEVRRRGLRGFAQAWATVKGTSEARAHPCHRPFMLCD